MCNISSNICFTLIFEIGTLGYVMSEIEGGKAFSQVVKDAKSLGYTEPGILIIALQLIKFDEKFTKWKDYAWL